MRLPLRQLRHDRGWKLMSNGGAGSKTTVPGDTGHNGVQAETGLQNLRSHRVQRRAEGDGELLEFF